DNSVRLWELRGGAAPTPDRPAAAKGQVREVRRFQGQGPYHSVALPRDGQVLVAADFGLLLDEGSGRVLSAMRVGVRCEKIVLSPDANWAAYITAERTVALWDVGAGKGLTALPAHAQPLRDAAFLP